MSHPNIPQLVYLRFAREVGPIVKAKYPHIEKVVFNKLLGKIWNDMPQSEKDIHHQKAEMFNNQNLQTESGQQEELNKIVIVDPVTENILLRKEESSPCKLSLGKRDQVEIYIKEEPGNETIAIEGIPVIGDPEHIDKRDIDISLNESDAPTNIEVENVETECVDYKDNGE